MLDRILSNRPVDVTTAHQMAQDDGVVLLDVRTRQEWKSGHSPDAMHISLQSLDTQMRRLPEDATILAICRSGSRSARAVSMLRASGLTARNVKGGMNAWSKSALPVTR